MTIENRERAYKHFRKLENSYVALPHLNKGMTETIGLRARAKVSADALLKRNPELGELDKPDEKVEEEKTKKTKKNSKEE